MLSSAFPAVFNLPRTGRLVFCPDSANAGVKGTEKRNMMGKIKGNETKCMIIGARNSVTGNIEGASPICINGKLIGNINSTSYVYISKTGSVDGSVTADHLVLLGNITGDSINAGKLVVTVTGVVNSDVKVAKLTVEEGGVLNGQVSVNGSHTPAEDEI